MFPPPAEEGQGEGLGILNELAVASSSAAPDQGKPTNGLPLRRPILGLAILAALASPTLAQDSTAIVLESLPDSLTAAPVRSPVLPLGPEPGRPASPTPALTAALDPTELLADVPGTFLYRLSAPGRADLSFDGLATGTPALFLDGRSFEDLITGAPRFDLLPSEALGPLRIADTRQGRPLAIEATTRPFRVALPVTELRYFGGQEGVQYASGTHAQTRRPPAFLRGSSDASRLTVTAHVATRAANGLVGSGGTTDGARERHSHALARALLTRPGSSFEMGALYTEQLDGAHRGFTTNVFNPLSASSLDRSATRKTIRNDLWLTSWLPIVRSNPTEIGAAWTSQRWRYVQTPGDTLAATANRLSGHLRQRVVLGPNHLHFRAGATWDTIADTSALFAPGSRSAFHASLLDSLAAGPVELAIQAGLYALDGQIAPSFALRAESGPASAGVRWTGSETGRIWHSGLGSLIQIPAEADLRSVRQLVADASLNGRRGDWAARLHAFGHHRTDARWIVSSGDTTYTLTGGLTADRIGATLNLSWRDEAARGLYVRSSITGTHAPNRGTSALRQLDAESLPTFWGRLRLGLRATNVGSSVADLDLALVAHGWSAFRSLVVVPATGQLALPDPTTSLGAELPARGTLSAEATATFSARASVFLRYDNALATRLYDGARVIQGEPIPATALRFGVFWALLD
ncbi:MAG: hypothetical protein Rubg2KO_02090 [Rubricoccaceae bacterium]